MVNKMGNAIGFYTKALLYKKRLYGIHRSRRHRRGTVILLLSAGQSSRFGHDCPKQIYEYDGCTIIERAIRIFHDITSHLVVVVNQTNAEVIRRVTDHGYNHIHIVATNQDGDRFDSIEIGLRYIRDHIQHDFQDIIIHDCARPFVYQHDIKKIMRCTCLYSQYVMKLTNGLLETSTNRVVNRDHYIELCTPMKMDYKLCDDLFIRFMSGKHRYVCEFIPLLKLYKIPMHFFQGSYASLRKITYLEDLVHNDENNYTFSSPYNPCHTR